MIARRSYTIDAKSLQSLRTITKWLITFRAFIQATSNKRDTILEKWKKFKHNDRTADQSKRVKASLPQSSSCHVVRQPVYNLTRWYRQLLSSQTGYPCGVERKRVSVYLTRQIGTVLNFSRSPLSAFIPRSDETVQTPYWQQSNKRDTPAKQGILVASNERECQCQCI